MTRTLGRLLAILGVLALGTAVAVPHLPHGAVIGVGLVGASLLAIAVLMSRETAADPRRRRVARVGAVLIALQIAALARAFRVAVVHPEEVASRRAVGEDDAVLTNPRLSASRLTQPRGRIVSADGTVVARSRSRGGVLRREYDEPSMHSLVGYVSPLKFGLSGLEESLDEELTGVDGMTVQGALRKALLGRPPSASTVHLTIDLPLQRLAAELLDGYTGAAILLETETGRVLAMASSPAIDPNRLSAVDGATSAEAQDYWDDLLSDERRPLLSRATMGLYPPGSTFKVVTAASAIEAGAANPDSIYQDTGELEVDGRLLIERNRPDASRTTWTLSEGLAYSLNLVYAQVGLAVGGEGLTERAAALGIGEEIPGDLPTESGQVASSAAFLSDPSALADTAFGQGELLVTPLHMALVASAVARDGTVPVPMLVDRVTADGDVVERRSAAVWRRAMSPATAAALDTMMVDSATYGYARTAAIEGLRIGAKTGTAESGRDEPHSWLIGYGGDGRRSIAVCVCIEFGGEGGGVALTVGRELLAAALTT